MKHTPLLAMLSLTLGIAPVTAAEWKPAKGPLSTRWAKDVTPEKVHPEYPRPQMTRPEWFNLNGLWQFQVATAEEAPPLGKELSGQILVPFPVESALSGVMKRADRVWYRRTFAVKKEWEGKHLLLHFGAVNWESTVWVNGKKLGTHQGGYDPFSYDITGALKADGPQEIVVGAWNPADAGTQPRGKQVRKPEGIWYTPSTGIWQTAWLEPVPATYLESLKIVPDVPGNRVRVTAHATGLKEGDQIEVQARVGGPLIRSGKAGEAIELVLPRQGVERWTPESPRLYDLTVRVRRGDRTVDQVTSYFGMRQIEVRKDDKGITRIHLNGKPSFQVGPLDQGFWPDGLYTAPTDEALKYDIEITKKLGFNVARKHVKVEPARWYYWCDKLGLLVWQDMPSGDRNIGPGQPEIKRTATSAKQYERELKRMIDNLHNHPCIVMWVPFNEGWGQFDTVRITEWVKNYDPTRLVDCASGWNDYPCGDVHDIHVYPGPGSPQPEEKRAAVLGEFGGLGLGIDGHTWEKKTWGYQGTKDSADLTRKYERLMRRVYELKNKPGMSAAIYTQTTDVETEANGLMTYDRAILKVDADRVAAVNRGDFSRVPKQVVVVPTSQRAGLRWRYTIQKPAKEWYKVDFDAKNWEEGPGGFGTRGTPGAVVRTEWKSPEIWLRREFTLPEGKYSTLYLLVHHDEDVEIYLNGVLAARAGGFLSEYDEMPIAAEALATLKPGKNVFAVHCKQTRGGQYIDVGLVELKTDGR